MLDSKPPSAQGFHFLASSICSVAVLSGTLILTGCASTSGQGTTDNAAAKVDPYEHINRKIYHFNDKVDDYVAKPISDAYKFVTPQFVQTGVFNFFNNLKNVNVVINDFLQGKVQQGFKDTGRLALNTTLGLGGLFDVAEDVGLDQNDEDFEQTLAVWGVPQGSYLVIPFLGPSTLRGIPGSMFDTAANPSTYVGWPIQLVSMLNARANAEGALKFIDEAALDPYVFTRESFLQWRNNLASDGKSSNKIDVSEFDEDLYEDDKKPATKAAPETEAKPEPALEVEKTTIERRHVVKKKSQRKHAANKHRKHRKRR